MVALIKTSAAEHLASICDMVASDFTPVPETREKVDPTFLLTAEPSKRHSLKLL